MKGCPLSCWWCHNPEGISPEPQTVVQTRKVGEKEFKREEKVGRYYSTVEILEILEKERIFIEQSGGGVTFSGGEPMMQSEFLLEALKAAVKMAITLPWTPLVIHLQKASWQLSLYRYFSFRPETYRR